MLAAHVIFSKPPGYPVRFARASLKLRNTFSASLARRGYPVRFARASLKPLNSRVGPGKVQGYPVRFARASLKRRASRKRQRRLSALSRAFCAGLIEASGP